MQTFFREHILGAKQMDFNHYLRLIGMRADVTWAPAVNQDGKHAVDLRVWPLSPGGEVKLRITHPNSAWARAGLRSGDKLVSADGKLIPDWPAFRNWLRQLKIGDTGRLTIVRDGTSKTVEVPLSPYDVPTVRLAGLSDATPAQIGLRNAWMDAK